MGFGIDRRARSRKGRGLFRRAPDPHEVGDRLGRLARRMLKDRVIRSGPKGDRYVLEVAFHANAPHAQLSVGADAELRLRAETAALGPGYHGHVIAQIAPILEELDYVWTDSFELAATQIDMCQWLAGQLAGHFRLAVPEERRFRIAAPLLTALGPRDEAWCDVVRADPRRAADAFPWWDLGPGRAERASALCAMWLDVPWREPLDASERALLKRVDEDLRAARKADPSLELPWPDWKQLLAHLGIEDEDVNEHAGDRPATIGYRRSDLDVTLSGGWSVCLPGAMVGHWEDEGGRYWATDGDRAVEFTSLTAPDETDSARLLAIAPEKYEVIARIDETDRHGRAEAYVDSGVPILIGLMARAPHVAILTCKGGDRTWALATWRSLTLAS